MLLILGIFLELICCGYVVVSLFRLLKINYFNPIVKLFTENLEPVSRSILFLITPLLASIIFSVFLRLISLIIIFPEAMIIQLLLISIFYVIFIALTIIFWCILGGVILSWVSPFSSHPFLQIVAEISSKSLQPIRKFLPPAGGLDFTPIIGFIILNTINFRILYPMLPPETRPFYLLGQLIG
tara:strand:- start:5387 stop:5935 length:549 start_codon:yes stop_codon:yes gene_type:complete